MTGADRNAGSNVLAAGKRTSRTGQTPTPLTSEALTTGALQGRGLRLPTYDRSALRVGIVHLGVGAFHRAHQAMYLDRLLEVGDTTDWAICGIGVLPDDIRIRDALGPQHGLYTLVEKGADGSVDAGVIGSLTEYLLAPDDPKRVIERLTDPQVRIVSLTITEGGYGVDPATGAFSVDSPAVGADLQPGALPRSVFGIVVEALARRRTRGVPPFAVMSCDNMPGNGGIARAAFTSFAALRSADLGAWVADEVSFPSSMVDRITPATAQNDADDVRERYGVVDRWPVMCEPWSQWVLEDDFTHGRPPLEDVGVQMVPDVRPYELMKLRLLNCGHLALAHIGHLAGHRYVHQAAQDPLLAAFLAAYLHEEAEPTLAPVPGIDLPDYERSLVERFTNPGLRDTIARLCAYSSDRMAAFLLPVVRDNLARGRSVRLAATMVAAWARYAEGVDEQGRPIEVVDRRAGSLSAAARLWTADDLAFLRDREVFGDLIDAEPFTREYVHALASLHDVGVRKTLTLL